eukprot:Hpha_TRINITY_DN23831_c0_g1::TRINITY_DN23831_c0_g1_i1::g.109810::m.109810/K01586/lysA; diaminopimelate decarboxylase
MATEVADCPAYGITDVSPLLRFILSDSERSKILKGDIAEVTAAPVAQFYDMDLWDAHLQAYKDHFGPTVRHCVAIKSNSITRMLRHIHQKHGMGIECASIGEVLHAMRTCGVPREDIVFDSPCKTEAELQFAIREKIHTNLDNFTEFTQAKSFVDSNTDTLKGNMGRIGFRINPLVGAGRIAALSVSTADSKFGTPISDREAILKAYVDNPWLNCVHVHVGSGGMGCEVLTAGIRVIVEFAEEVNRSVGHRQVECLDIGGGLPANYSSDAMEAEKNPSVQSYAAHLRREVPQLFTGEYEVVTEFGQSINAKAGVLVSKIEWMKGTPDSPMAIVHFGASECVRQVYGGAAHARRLEGYSADGSRFEGDATRKYAVGGPLCFQGDFVAKEVELPAALQKDDYIVMKDAGANTLSLFSRHCSRLCPPVYGFRWNADKSAVVSLEVLKPRETIDELSRFWGPV